MSRTPGRTLLHLLRHALVGLGALGLAATFAPLLDAEAGWIVILSFPRVQIGALLGLVLLALVLPPWRVRPASLLGVAFCLAGILGQATILWPYAPWARTEVETRLLCEPQNRLRVAAVNVKMTNEHANDLLRAVRSAKPDLIFFQETDAWWSDALDPLEALYPHRVSQPMQNFYGIELFSRLPLVTPETRRLTSSRDPSVFTGVRLPSGAVVRFYGLHPRPPRIHRSAAERDGQIMAAALAIRGDGAPSILAGDLNAPPWAGVVRRAARVARLLDPRRGRGWRPTFRDAGGLLAWPIDHVLVSEDFVVGDLRALPARTSDHRPIYADLCLRPEAAARQSAPALRPGDLEAARRAVVAGQDRATARDGASPEKQSPEADAP